MQRGLVGIVLIAVALVADRAVTAHHSFAAQYDRSKTITITGSVTKLEWMNPHIYFYVDVKDAAGTTTNWSVEGGAPNTLYRAGWRRNSVKVGDVVTVNGYLARDGSNLVNLASAVLADGRNLFVGGQYYGPQQGGQPPRR